MGESIEPAFIQALEHRPNTQEDTAQLPETIPTIDLSLLNSPAEPLRLEGLVKEIGRVCKEWGFFQVVNHGVPSEVRQRMEKAAKEFYDQPLEEKMKVKRDAENPMGYHDSEHTKNVRDWKEVFDFFSKEPAVIPASENPDDQELRTVSNRWPQYPPEFREVCKEYSAEVEKLAYKVLGLVSLSLGLPADRLNEYFNHQLSFTRLNHYPPCPAPDLALGVGRHKDAGAITVLAQDEVGGLEVSRKSDGKWFPIKPTPDAYIINIGNCMQVWSNDELWTAEHRVVVNSEKERFSMPFFFFPSHYVGIKPLEELVNNHNCPNYKEYNWGKFFASRNRSDYSKRQIENIQIDQFKLSN
ncbi:unnamed protein product [Linum trigynum]|uniref:Fe2OG dioxygenase domain-containing protein n=1 Tax=Linum trigynum TaxID=586398 RepID=A0AAV2ETS6_9ROSI